MFLFQTNASVFPTWSRILSLNKTILDVSRATRAKYKITSCDILCWCKYNQPINVIAVDGSVGPANINWCEADLNNR